jgi:hypothetical protein
VIKGPLFREIVVQIILKVIQTLFNENETRLLRKIVYGVSFSQKFVSIILTFSLTINPTTIPKSFSQRLSYNKF